jgi:hypothetical protein
MATRTLGSTAQTTLTAVLYNAALLTADRATIEQGILDDGSAAVAGGTAQQGQTVELWGNAKQYPGAFGFNGLLYVPNRGVLRCFEGDFVAIDSTGWPILLSAAAAASGSWVHT